MAASGETVGIRSLPGSRHLVKSPSARLKAGKVKTRARLSRGLRLSQQWDLHANMKRLLYTLSSQPSLTLL